VDLIAMKKLISVLGSTGSIGQNTLDVLDRHPDLYRVFALSAATSVDKIWPQCQKYLPEFVVMVQAESAKTLQEKINSHGLKIEVLTGEKSLDFIASHEKVDIVMAAIVGAAGLKSSIAAAKAGKRLLLANKEALVVGGDLFCNAVAQGGATLLPIDSEHSAIFQALPTDQSVWASQVEKIILTASGGPFRARDPLTLRDVTPEQACAHPNWVMGRKISVDSATMMNKALEVVEAKYLFNMSPDQIDVVIHPQSVIHSMVQFVDTSVIAQLGTPDMRMPISYGLAWPHRIASGAPKLDFKMMKDLSFEAIDQNGHPERFPALSLAWDCLRGPAGSCVILNAANEVAVACFLEKNLGFDQIASTIQESLAQIQPGKVDSIDDLIELDQKSRKVATEIISRKFKH
jgi:1-deoxy-D-xylulose-5-phosphate reductoisomerase